MNRQDVRALADRLIRPVVGDDAIEGIEVREGEDWSGAASLYVDVYIQHGASLPDTEAWSDTKLRLSAYLAEEGETRFPYIRLRDRKGEGALPDEAA